MGYKELEDRSDERTKLERPDSGEAVAPYEREEEIRHFKWMLLLLM